MFKKKLTLSFSIILMLLCIIPSFSNASILIKDSNTQSLAPMLKTVTPAVVSIAVEGKKITKSKLPDNIPEQFKHFFGPNFPKDQATEQPFAALGSGVIINAEKGYVVTNYHVIKDADKITVALNDGREIKAKLMGDDEMSDIALLQLDNTKDLSQIPLANSDNLQVGDFVVAIGNPFGLGETVTSGIISALGRSGLNLENYESFIQTDAAINTGNSGGALVNLNGQLIGINTAIVGPNGGNVGIGFAIPSNMVKNLVNQIVKYGKVRRAVLGIIGSELTADLAKAFDYNTNHGAFISQVLPDSAASKAGLKPGDIITSLDNKKINTFAQLRANIGTMGIDKTITLGILRNGKNLNVKVTLESAKGIPDAETKEINKVLNGTTLQDINSGIKVVDITKDSSAYRYGLRQNDIIIGLNKIKINNKKELEKELLKHKNDIIALHIKRQNATLFIIMK